MNGNPMISEGLPVKRDMVSVQPILRRTHGLLPRLIGGEVEV